MDTSSQNMSTPHHGLQTVTPNSSTLAECVEVRFSEMEYLPWDNPGNIVSAGVETFLKRMKDVMTSLLFLIGGPANIINMAVFYKQGLRDRVNLCLFSLSFTDCVHLLASMVLHVENVYLLFSGEENIPPANKMLTNNNFIIFMGLCFVSLVHSAIIACERCYCVFSPLKYQTVLRTKTMVFIIVGTYVSVLGLFFIVTFRYRVGCIYDPDTGMILQAMVTGPFYRRHKDGIDFLDSVVFGAGFPGGTILVVLVATILTIVKLRKIMTWRSGTSTSLSPREVALTKMLIGSSVFFIICISPSCVFRIVSLFLPEMRAGGRHHNFNNTTLWIFSVFTFVNSAFNFFIYYGMGSRYRETFWLLFGKNMVKMKRRNAVGKLREGTSETSGQDKASSTTECSSQPQYT